MTGQPAAAPGADAPRGRTYSITELADMTGWHRDTISDWCRRRENPLPYESGGRHGVEYQISLRRFVEWREKVATAEGALKASTQGGFTFMGITDSYKAIMARDKWVRMGEAERSLVHRAPMQSAMERAFGLVRQAVMAIPDRIARDMAGFPADRVAGWRREARGYCTEALADAANAIRQAAEAAAARGADQPAAAKGDAPAGSRDAAA